MRRPTIADTSLFDFGPLAKDYDRWYETRLGRVCDRRQKGDMRQLLPKPGPGSRLLDIGCGTGHWSQFFASLGYVVHGIDSSPEMIAVAQGKALAGCTFEIADALALPLADGSFDVVALITVLEFIACPKRAVSEAARCTRTGGSLMVGTLNRLALLNQHRVARHEEPYASASMYSPEELTTLLIEQGHLRLLARPSYPLMVAEVKL
jgi:ubiquinone/menaquinone biosynthesis C-methylase UbiE